MIRQQIGKLFSYVEIDKELAHTSADLVQVRQDKARDSQLVLSKVDEKVLSARSEFAKLL